MAEALLTSLQETALAQWVSGSSSIWGYPTILTLHTVGLALLVGLSVALDLRLLGVGRAAPLVVFRPLFRVMWLGLIINAITGVLLFIADAVHKAGQTVFWIKLICIALALVVLVKQRPFVFSGGATEVSGAGGRARRLAALSLLLWSGAMIAGRLMAYL
jgi:hypothetical protein